MGVACEIKGELSKLDEDVKDVLRVSEVATGAEVSGVSHVTEDISGAFQVATGGNAVAEESGATNGGTTGVSRAVRAAGSGVSRCYDGVDNPSVVHGVQEGSTKGGDGNVPPVSLHTVMFFIYCTNDTLYLFHVPLLSNNINTGWHIPSLLPITPRH